MKMSLAILVLLFSGLAFADANSDAYKAGSSFGKGSASQGTSTLKNTDAVSSAIPGYTSNPSEKNYYGGVTGGDSGLSDKGQSALQGSNAGQAVIDASTKNPSPVIDPNAPFITIGKNAEATAGSIMDGSSSQCTQSTVSKSTFENYTCSADVTVQAQCTRTTVAGGAYQNISSTETINVPPESWNMALSDDGEQKVIVFSFPAPAGATMVSGSVQMLSTALSTSSYNSTVNFYGQSHQIQNQNDSWALNVGGKTVPADGLLRGTITNQYDVLNFVLAGLAHNGSTNNNLLQIAVTLTVVTTKSVFVPQVTTPPTCDNGKGGKLVSSVCSIPGGDRTVVVNGVEQVVHSDCWQYLDTYLASEDTAGTCSSLISNPACTKSAENCTEYVDGVCSHKDYTYQCQTVYSSSGLVCGGQYICQSGSCDDTSGAGDSGFDTAVAKLAGLASAAEDVKSDTVNVKAFSGQAMSCRKAFAGFSNCCKDSGWGTDAGLAACNSDEMAVGKAKAKKVTVSVGERCDHKVLGACVQKSQVYCVFQGKLARIIQEQGRRDQLGVSFGSGDNPDCRGITVPELQNINFDLINFADFYEDLMNNQKIPDASTMAQLAKDRVAAQVNQMGGSK